MKTEIEAKFLNIDPTSMRALLSKNRYICTIPERMMTRATLHTPADRRNIHEWWRVRDEGNGRITMTWKRTDSNEVDGTQELEIEVSDFEMAVTLLMTTGLLLVARQETKRETWYLDDIEVVIDTWPGLKPFIEIEGSTIDGVARAASKLGFNMDQAVFGGVGNVYQRELGFIPEAVNHWPLITFSNPPRRVA
jgi:adenylate cyclase class 2